MKYQWLDGTDSGFSAGKVVCVGRNYVDHVKELNNAMPTEPLLFIKPATSVCNANGEVILNKALGDHHFEAELALLIGKPLNRNTIDEYQSCIAGLGVAFDLTLRDKQSELKQQGYPWEMAKAYDNACPVSPFVPYSGEALNCLHYEFYLNNALQQRGDSANMMFPIEQLLQQIVCYFSLEPGDIVLTGTPKGVGKFSQGDEFKLILGDKLLASGSIQLR